jgi:hypothetical protein
MTRGKSKRMMRSAMMVIVLIMVGLLAAGGGQDALAGDTRQVNLVFAASDTMMLPQEGSIVGLAWQGPDTLVVLQDIPAEETLSGIREVKMVFQDRDGILLRMEDYSGVLDRGLAWDGASFWSCGDSDDGMSMIYQIEPDTLHVVESFMAPGHHPRGMSFDGRYIWIADRDAGRIDRLDIETGDITRSVVTPGYSPSGLAWGGTHMFVTDSGTGKMYRLRGARRTWNGTVDAASFMYRGQDVLLLGDVGGLWFVPPGENFMVRALFQ